MAEFAQQQLLDLVNTAHIAPGNARVRAIELERDVAPVGYESLGVTAPLVRSHFDLVLQPATSAGEALPAARMARAGA
jgi:hypothetical protein